MPQDPYARGGHLHHTRINSEGKARKPSPDHPWLRDNIYKKRKGGHYGRSTNSTGSTRLERIAPHLKDAEQTPYDIWRRKFLAGTYDIHGWGKFQRRTSARRLPNIVSGAERATCSFYAPYGAGRDNFLQHRHLRRGRSASPSSSFLNLSDVQWDTSINLHSLALADFDLKAKQSLDYNTACNLTVDGFSYFGVYTTSGQPVILNTHPDYPMPFGISCYPVVATFNTFFGKLANRHLSQELSVSYAEPWFYKLKELAELFPDTSDNCITVPRKLALTYCLAGFSDDYRLNYAKLYFVQHNCQFLGGDITRLLTPQEQLIDYPLFLGLPVTYTPIKYVLKHHENAPDYSSAAKQLECDVPSFNYHANAAHY